MHPINYRPAGILLLAILTTACSGGPKIVSNHDPDADFASYKTYNFVDPLSTDRAGARALLSGFLISSTAAELEARGMKQAWPDPDLLIDFIVSAQQKLQSSGQYSSSAVIHGGRAGAGTWAGYGMGVSTTSITQSTQGTVAIDMIDRARNQLVWEVAATGRVTDEIRNDLQSVVPNTVAEMFAKYPVPPLK